MKLKRRFLLFILYAGFLSGLLRPAIYMYKHPADSFDMSGHLPFVTKKDSADSVGKYTQLDLKFCSKF